MGPPAPAHRGAREAAFSTVSRPRRFEIPEPRTSVGVSAALRGNHEPVIFQNSLSRLLPRPPSAGAAWDSFTGVCG
jgi:hypothetical protein